MTREEKISAVNSVLIENGMTTSEAWELASKIVKTLDGEHEKEII